MASTTKPQMDLADRLTLSSMRQSETSIQDKVANYIVSTTKSSKKALTDLFRNENKFNQERVRSRSLKLPNISDMVKGKRTKVTINPETASSVLIGKNRFGRLTKPKGFLRAA